MAGSTQTGQTISTASRHPDPTTNRVCAVRADARPARSAIGNAINNQAAAGSSGESGASSS